MKQENSSASWAAGPNNTRLWGSRGAAGLLLVAPDSSGKWSVLMQHRAAWTAQGDTWALPGGAREPYESVIEAALREAQEETGITPEQVHVIEALITAGPFPADPARPELAGGWTYTTVIARAMHQLTVVPNAESAELRWVDWDEVTELKLLPAFAQAWPGLKEKLGQLLCQE
ncbi:NUDIX hydrolase [Corynebacterium sp. sy017]|uniref:NUDIX domain-containing protein n=1 Tax=unclassified Corynebacterium TaxID=2624378 RepID=UPI001184A7E5|nr:MULTISPECIES: NUDIX hydrolase [unclassified Corynebacterium]MBP3088444.1 NUDIX hydrolase [Corynebacterium sp. sy017]QDZ41879.1 NUDIX hydrolase [Corynebacterium sp. sy039]TSD91753.1 NUDIX hydrolase [Corynebacterium sp. SY003]